MSIDTDVDEPDFMSIGTVFSFSEANSRNYNYDLNTNNQTRRLVSNASKKAIDVKYNNFQDIAGTKYATNVNIECNAGVYMSAIKPGLESIKEGWKADIDNHRVTCSYVSPRNDKSNAHNICTQITLLISSKTDPSTRTKADLHCYHTDNKIQLQGGPLGSTGLSSASWIAKNLIIPLTHSHIEKNQENIRCINEEILATPQEPSCEKCKKAIAGDTSAAKDQDLSAVSVENFSTRDVQTDKHTRVQTGAKIPGIAITVSVACNHHLHSPYLQPLQHHKLLQLLLQHHQHLLKVQQCS